MQMVKKWWEVVQLPKWNWKKFNKDEKGLTLIELLAVIVILGIIAAIAIPSVNSIIKNTEAKAQKANAEHFISTAKLAIADRTIDAVGEDYSGTFDTTKLDHSDYDDLTVRQITLQHLVDGGYLEESNLEDPQSTSGYDLEGSYVVAAMMESESEEGEYVVKWQYFINLQEADGKTYFDEVAESAL